PELPEVETVAAGLRNSIIGQRIVSGRLLTKQLARVNPKNFSAVVSGKTIRSVNRKGKQIVIELTDDWILWVHFMMTGKLWLLGLDEPVTKFDGAIFQLQPLGKKLVFYDQRRFGRIKLLRKNELAQLKEYVRLGPDALTVSSEGFIQRLKARKKNLKSLLLDQTAVAGLGNIYADESLFLAKIHPAAHSSRLSMNRLSELYSSMQKVLAGAIRVGGSSIRDYSAVDGQRGYFQIEHQVYQKTGLPCPICGRKIERITIAQRSTHFCPRCQRK
ncbi:MAG TPA: bifunctional DNA-formamidopyrimidine glycosylase/DNA-(apurinic or apyrimidinic site) lyase, partial [candidate division Zixibacteria bacterium]|nr:bifunctional DNA-formamidopyrimidine glycosylase/DNA-(apurinic or apyrimidinic site) lyase [candidate division Zixibacteria bacterium]